MKLTVNQKLNLLRWAKALESGDYKQRKGRFYRLLPNGDREYCSLGVGYEISGLGKFNKTGVEYIIKGQDGDTDIICSAFTKYYGFSAERGARWWRQNDGIDTSRRTFDDFARELREMANSVEPIS